MAGGIHNEPERQVLYLLLGPQGQGRSHHHLGQAVFRLNEPLPLHHRSLSGGPLPACWRISLELTQEEASEIMAMAQAIVTATRAALTPEGFNMGINMGTVAGAGIADHLHMHIVPRWKGDTNFMPVLGDVHIISEHIEKTRDKIKRNLP